MRRYLVAGLTAFVLLGVVVYGAEHESSVLQTAAWFLVGIGFGRVGLSVADAIVGNPY